jgi:hypothetical protein
MSFNNILGAIMVASPFVGIFFLAKKYLGWKIAIAIYLATAALIGLIVLGTNLLLSK